jgi:hypothetical protein
MGGSMKDSPESIDSYLDGRRTPWQVGKGFEACREVDREVAMRLKEPIGPRAPRLHWTRRFAGELLSRSDVSVLLGNSREPPRGKEFDGKLRWHLGAILGLLSRRRVAA